MIYFPPIKLNLPEPQVEKIINDTKQKSRLEINKNNTTLAHDYRQEQQLLTQGINFPTCVHKKTVNKKQYHMNNNELEIAIIIQVKECR